MTTHQIESLVNKQRSLVGIVSVLAAWRGCHTHLHGRGPAAGAAGAAPPRRQHDQRGVVAGSSRCPTCFHPCTFLHARAPIAGGRPTAARRARLLVTCTPSSAAPLPLLHLMSMARPILASHTLPQFLSSCKLAFPRTGRCQLGPAEQEQWDTRATAYRSRPTPLATAHSGVMVISLVARRSTHAGTAACSSFSCVRPGAKP